MDAHPTPSDFEARTNATFDALMWALSRPGRPRDLPEPGLAPIAEALIDQECHVHSDDPEIAAFAERLGAHRVAPEAADHLFLRQVPDDCPQALRQGSDLYPEEGATLVAEARIGTGLALRLTGPGIDGAENVRVGGIDAEFWGRRARVMRYPMGVELFIVDGTRVLGFPRSTHVEVL